VYHVEQKDKLMDKLKEYIDLQIEFNQGRNLFHKEFNETMKFTESTLEAILNLDKIVPGDLDLLIDYTSERVLQEFCRVNQYFSFQEKDKSGLKKIYRDLCQNIIAKKDITAQTHYENLKVWLEKTNPFSQEIYREKDAVLESVVCSEYSATLQKEILHLNNIQLLEPVLDIGCGKAGNLVKYLRNNGIEAYGIDRFSDNSPYIEKTDWLQFNYGIEKWGTIVSNLGFSNHFIHNHLREDGCFVEYAKKYMSILKSLKPGGCFCYAPDLPFIEKYLDRKRFLITKYDIEDLSFKTTVIKQLE
jgi:SAM-dependent methyltransferase